MTTPADPKAGGHPQTEKPRKPSGEIGHERPADDPGRGQGDVFDEKLPPEPRKEGPAAGS